MSYYPANTASIGGGTIKSQYDMLLENSTWLLDRQKKQSVQAQGLLAAPTPMNIIGATYVLTNTLTIPSNDLEDATWAMGVSVEGQQVGAGSVNINWSLEIFGGFVAILPLCFSVFTITAIQDRSAVSEPVQRVLVPKGVTNVNFRLNGTIQALSTANFNVWRAKSWAFRVA